MDRERQALVGNPRQRHRCCPSGQREALTTRRALANERWRALAARVRAQAWRASPRLTREEEALLPNFSLCASSIASSSSSSRPTSAHRARAPPPPRAAQDEWVPVLDVFSHKALSSEDTALLHNVIRARVTPAPVTVSYTQRPL